MAGNKNKFKNKLIDELIMQGVQLGATEHTLDIMRYHEYFFYYPHYDTTLAVIKDIIQKDATGEKIMDVVKMLGVKHFIKLNEEIMKCVEDIDVQEKPFLVENKGKFVNFYKMVKRRYAYLMDN